MIPSEEQIKSFDDKQGQQQCMMGQFGVLVNTANVFDEMKNYILVFTLLQRCFVICTDTHVQSANTGLHGFTHQHISHTDTLGCTQTHTDHLTGGALACCVCWHVFKVCVTVCLPVPVSVSLVFPCQSTPWQSPGEAWAAAASIVGILAAHSGLSKVCLAHHYLHAVRLIRQQWELRNERPNGGGQSVNRGGSRMCLCHAEKLWFGEGTMSNLWRSSQDMKPLCVHRRLSFKKTLTWMSNSWEALIITHCEGLCHNISEDSLKKLRRYQVKLSRGSGDSQ